MDGTSKRVSAGLRRTSERRWAAVPRTAQQRCAPMVKAKSKLERLVRGQNVEGTSAGGQEALCAVDEQGVQGVEERSQARGVQSLLVVGELIEEAHRDDAVHG